ncbi:hypothetical protein LEP1GSC123_1040 [Leptospira borgpetersenii str. 200701203]|uniref:Uncharacterized protein n=1 Tax=Leptospira borgpetersenii str. 200701203 TaxID=1193007 RepID=M3H279_LEPBO|nr:hypothetical protein LEP1GSC123_1040 [Leptospira borgpetersenii str. 200701203]
MYFKPVKLYLEFVSKPEENISKRSGKFLKSVGVPTETVVLTVFSVL